MARTWQRTKFDAGWAAPHWPREFGGQGLTGIEAGVFTEEESRFDVAANFFMVGIDMAGPTLMAHGSPEQQNRFLEPMLRGDESWCQLFSEPGSGSDLASLSTRAVRDGDEWILNGQKVWTSSAHTADWGMCLAPDQPRRGEARGDHLLPRRHARSRRGRAAAAADRRCHPLQRGVPRRRARARTTTSSATWATAGGWP